MYFDKPNYSEYSEKELLEALQELNREKFPDRLTLIENELKARQSTSDLIPEVTHLSDSESMNGLAKRPISNMERVFYHIFGLIFLILGIKELVTGKVSGKAGTITILDSPLTFSFAVIMDFIIAGIAFYVAVRSPSTSKRT